MMKYYHSVYGCPEPGSYSLSMNKAIRAGKPAVKGRSRHTLNDTYPVQTTSLKIPMNSGQFAGWTAFWEALNFGTDDFLIDLWDENGETEYIVHATGPYSASVTPDNIWDVQLPLEVRL